jgi:hypothetical protein
MTVSAEVEKNRSGPGVGEAGGLQIGRRSRPLGRLGALPGTADRQPGSALGVALKVLAIAVCATVLGLCLPGFDTLDYWIGMAAFLVALVVAATL